MSIKPKRLLPFILSVFVALSSLVPIAAAAEAAGKKVVRVGWYESTYCYRDKFGRRSGIAYEYQERIAAHTGWTYEYVEDSWPNLFQMLKDGEIDLLSDVSYTDERAEQMLFPSIAMGAESYYIYIDYDNKDISADDLTTFNGKKIAVNKGSFQAELLKSWSKKNDISPEIVETTYNEDKSLAAVTRGELDAMVTMDSFGAQDRVAPVCKIGSSDYYFAVNKDRPDLLTELNTAMNSIQDEDPYFNQRMFDAYIHLTKTNAFLSASQENWLAEHGAVRVGYRRDYLPFCAQNEEDGDLTGALKDYLAFASKGLKNTEVSFEAVPYDNFNDAREALKNGEVDCIFPVNISTYEGEQMGIISVSPIMQTEVYVVVKPGTEKDFFSAKAPKVAVNEGDINFETFIKDYFPEWEIVKYPTVNGCLDAVTSRQADCTLISSYRIHELGDVLSRYELSTMPTGQTVKYSFAVNRDEVELYSILNKISNLTKAEDKEAALLSYLSYEHEMPLMQVLKENWLFVVIGVTAVFAVIIILLLQKLNAERKVIEQQKQMEESLRREIEQKEQIKEVTKIAYTDTLTGVKSKHAFEEAKERLDNRIKSGEALHFAIIMFDLNDLKKVNDTQGHEVGDKYIKEGCMMICKRFTHSPVFRIGGDEFVAVLERDDYSNRDTLMSAFEEQVEKNRQTGGVVVAAGCACYDSSQDSSAHGVLERADEKMYEKKRELKDKLSTD